MSNDSSPVGGAHGFDSEALEEWVAETATQKGVSKQQLLDEILSSYWVLEELSGVVTDSEVQGGGSDGQPPVDGRADQGADAARGQSDSSPSSSPSSSAEFSELKSELQGLRAAIEELSRDQDGEREDAEPTEEGFSALEGQLEELSSAVVERQTETDETVAELADRIEALADRVGGIDDRTADLTDRLTAVESELDAGMSLTELETAVGRTSSAQTELEARLESEFDSIEQVLQHLLDTTDNIEYRLGAVSESRQEALKPIRERHAEQEALAELKSEAIRHDVTRAACDNCEQTVDLGLLERPVCPGCERRFTGIKKSGWFPLSSAELQTTDRPREDPGGRQRSATDDELPNESTADERDGFGMSW
ncbi:MAG: hypothetical protein ACOC0Z_02100 [Halohasta sp.]